MAGREREITLRFLAEPTDVNFGGKVHGGTAMKWIDLAAYACAAGWSGKYCVTAYAGAVQFVRAIHVGNIVEVEAKLVYTGRSSMHILLEVRAGDPKTSTRHTTTRCMVIMVAVDDAGEPTEIPEWKPETDEDKRLRESALKLIELRKGIHAEMEPLLQAAP